MSEQREVVARRNVRLLLILHVLLFAFPSVVRGGPSSDESERREISFERGKREANVQHVETPWSFGDTSGTENEGTSYQERKDSQDVSENENENENERFTLESSEASNGSFVPIHVLSNATNDVSKTFYRNDNDSMSPREEDTVWSSLESWEASNGSFVPMDILDNATNNDSKTFYRNDNDTTVQYGSQGERLVLSSLESSEASNGSFVPIHVLSNATNDDSKTFYRNDNDTTVQYVSQVERLVSSSLESSEASNSSFVQNGMSSNSSCTLSRPCVPLCCPPSSRVSKGTCLEVNESFVFPAVHQPNFTLSTKKLDDQSFSFFVWDPCNGGQRYKLTPDEFEDDAYVFLENGTIYQPIYGKLLSRLDYCLGVVEGDAYDVILCFEENPIGADEEDPTKQIAFAFPIGMIVSVPFLFTTWLVYTLLPELANMHGRTLRSYVGSLILAYVVLAVVQISPQERISDALCIVMAFTIHFSFLASFFWLNVMCFDIWWTFGGFRSLQGSVKQRERKKFIMYSIYAWGSASLLTGICAVMDFVPSIPKSFIKPEFGVSSCWFTTDAAKAIYFYGPMGVTVFCNICLFVSTALKIVQHKKDTAHHLKGTDSRRHDDNKQWFNLYLKLFIVMGINWSMEIISWLCKSTPQYVWYITDLANTLQGLIIFLIFVWKDKIRKLLLKKFGCLNRDVLSRNSTRSAYHSTASRTCTTSAAPLQEKVNPFLTETSYRARAALEDSDCA